MTTKKVNRYGVLQALPETQNLRLQNGPFIQEQEGFFRRLRTKVEKVIDSVLNKSENYQPFLRNRDSRIEVSRPLVSKLYYAGRVVGKITIASGHAVGYYEEGSAEYEYMKVQLKSQVKDTKPFVYKVEVIYDKQGHEKGETFVKGHERRTFPGTTINTPIFIWKKIRDSNRISLEALNTE